jgi:hypothetical protein
MKKLLLICCIILFNFNNNAKAQNPVNVGKMQLNAGVGLSNYGLPLYVGLDYGILPDITIGGEVSFRSYRENYFGTKYGHTIFGFSVNGNYHFNTLIGIPDNYDFYAGANIGFFTWNSPRNYIGRRSSGLGLGLQIGGRYYFNEKFGINLELGAGNFSNGGKIGVSVRF